MKHAAVVDKAASRRLVAIAVKCVGILAIAKKRAALLRDVPRDQVAARFTQLSEEIRQEAIAKGTAIDGDLVGD